MEQLQEEFLSGKDDCLSKLLSVLEGKSLQYFHELCDVFGSVEYIHQFRQCYEHSEFPLEEDHAHSPLNEQLCAVLELRALLATEVEALQYLRQEVEDYPTDFDIQNRLAKSLNEQQQLERELDGLREKNEQLRMENDAFKAIMDDVKREFNEKLAEANERAKKAEKAFVDLTRRRSTIIPREKNSSSGKPSDETPKRQTDTISSISYAYRPSLDSIRQSSKRFKDFNTLTAWDGFDSLDEDSSNEDAEKSQRVIKCAKLDSKSPPTTAVVVPTISLVQPVIDPAIKSISPEPVAGPGDEDNTSILGVDPIVIGLIPSKSSTPRKSIPSAAQTPRQIDTSPPESTIPFPIMPSLTAEDTMLRCARSVTPKPTEFVDKEVYLKLYDEVLELRSQLEKVYSKSNAQSSFTHLLCPSPMRTNELGLTTQLGDLRDHVCGPPQDSSFASAATTGGLPVPIPLSDNKHLTDWSISLDQTNMSSMKVETDEKPHADEEEKTEETCTPHSSMSLSQKTDGPLSFPAYSSDNNHAHVDLTFTNHNNPPAPGGNTLSPTSTLQELNVDLSECTTRMGVVTEFTEVAFSPLLDPPKVSQDVDEEHSNLPTEILIERNRQLSNSLVETTSICIDLQKRLSVLRCRATSDMSSSHFVSIPDVSDSRNCDVDSLTVTLQHLDAEVGRLDAALASSDRRDFQPSHEAEISDLRAKLQEAENLLEERFPKNTQIGSFCMNDLLEAERELLQRELNQRVADFENSQATSMAKLEKAQVDLTERLSVSETRACQLETERNAIRQKLTSTERFLNEQLQERETEREEFQSEIGTLRSQLTHLRSKLTYLEKQQQQPRAPPTPGTSPQPDPLEQPVDSSTPAHGHPRAEPPSSVSFGFDESLDHQKCSSHSDVDDSPAFELAPTPRLLGELQTTAVPHNSDWLRPHSAGDAVLRQHLAQHSQIPVRHSTACVGGSPVERVDVSVSVQSSLSECCSTSTEFEDGGLLTDDEEEQHEDDVKTKTTTASTVGVIATTVTTTTTTTAKKKPQNLQVIHKRRSRSSRHLLSPLKRENVVGLDVEMRHVAELDKLREALALTQSTLDEKNSEIDLLRKDKPPTSDQHQQFQFLPKIFYENVLIQTSPNASTDFGPCWSCNAMPSDYSITAVQTYAALADKSRESTLSPPPQEDRSISSTSSNAHISVSSPHTASGTDSDTGDVEEEEEKGVVEQMVEEDELCQPLEQIHSFSSETDHLLADLEEARAEIQALKAEINGLTSYQDDLHKDFELVQSMLEERQSEVEHLQQKLLAVPERLQSEFKTSIRKLQSKMSDKCEAVEERDEDLYVLNEEKEALSHRVAELTNELAQLRGHGSDNNREDVASQTDIPNETAESGIQVDMSRPSDTPPPSTAASCADTDCVSEDDLPYDSDHFAPLDNVAATLTAAPPIPMAPKTAAEVKTAVDHLQHETCRLLSLSLGVVDETEGKSIEPTDYKSQLLCHLLEANRMLKSALDEICRQLYPTVPTEVPRKTSVTEETSPAPKDRLISTQLCSCLLSALLSDRKASLSLLTSETIDFVSCSALRQRPRSGDRKIGSPPSINEVMKALADYSDIEEKRWNVLSSSLELHRKVLVSESTSQQQRIDSLIREVAHLTDQLARRDGTLQERDQSLALLAAKLTAAEASSVGLEKRLEEESATADCHLRASRLQVQEEQKKLAELESRLEVIQEALSQASDRAAVLEGELKASGSEVLLERNGRQLADEQITKLQQEIKLLKSSYVRHAPKTGVNGVTVSLQNSGMKKEDASRVSDRLTSARRQVLHAEQMSRDLHACTQDLRVTLTEAELALLPVSLGRENGLIGSASSLVNSSGGEDEIPSCEVNRPLPRQLTDSGFADAPLEIRRLYQTCMRLLHLVSSYSGDHLANSSSSSDSLNNPAELLRHGALGGRPTYRRLTYLDNSSADEVNACLSELSSHVRTLVASDVSSGDTAFVNNAATTVLAQARQMILNGVAQLDFGFGRLDACLPSESKSTQCSLVTNHVTSGNSNVVSLQKFWHMSARYLRMESYRRALVYQKQYLLLLLGDFQYNVQPITARLGQGLLMGTSSRQEVDEEDLIAQEWPLDSRPSRVRFRAAAWCIMFIHRVKQMRLKWQRIGISNQASPFPNSLGRSRRQDTSSSLLTTNGVPAISSPSSPTHFLHLTHPKRPDVVTSSRLSEPRQQQSAVSQRTGLFGPMVELNRIHQSTSTVLPLSPSNLYTQGEQIKASSSFELQHRAPPPITVSSSNPQRAPFKRFS